MVWVFTVSPCCLCLYFLRCIKAGMIWTPCERNGKHVRVSPKVLVCLWECVISVVNGCSTLITAGTSESHGHLPFLFSLMITRVNHLTSDGMPRGISAIPGSVAPFCPRRSHFTSRGHGPVVLSLAWKIMAWHQREMCQTSLRADYKQEKTTLTVIYPDWEVAGLWSGLQRLYPGMMMSWFQCLLSVNSQTEKGLCSQWKGSSWSCRGEKQSLYNHCCRDPVVKEVKMGITEKLKRKRDS